MTRKIEEVQSTNRDVKAKSTYVSPELAQLGTVEAVTRASIPVTF